MPTKAKKIRKKAKMVLVAAEEHSRLQAEVVRLRGTLQKLKKLVQEEGDRDFPPMPPMDDKGCYPAQEAIRIGLARTIIERRKAAGWTQEELARAAGVRQETVSRLETGKHAPNIRTVDRIDLALKSAGF
jgi:DNA-binding XRE family transcriptional regulator